MYTDKDLHSVKEDTKNTSSLMSSIISYIPSWNSETKTTESIDQSGQELLKINNELTTLFSTCLDKDGKKIDCKSTLELPEIITVGSQSSGKSSVGNGIIGMDIFPTGKGIVTRTPIHIQMVNVATLTNTKVEFGCSQNGKWCSEKIYDISLEPTKDELNKLREEIKTQTIKRAGNKSGISDVPIFIKIMSPKIHDLTIVDLPGITTVADIESDQPVDIEDQIKKLIETHIISERAIILVIVPATTDPEADIAMGYVKKYDKKGNRTICVLTKVDLMNKDTDVCKYITGNVCHNLQFKYGYYAVKNRAPTEIDVMSITQGYESEKIFFKQHSLYSKLTEQNRLGISSLVTGLKHILITHIRSTLPDIIKEIRKREQEVDSILISLGYDVPEKPEEQITKLGLLISDFCQKFTSYFDNSSRVNIGRKCREIFDTFRNDIDKIQPFNKDNYSDEYITNVMKDCQGDAMASPVPTINVLEKCLKEGGSDRKKPILALLDPSEICLKNIQSLVIEIISKFADMNDFSRFPKFINSIQDCIISKLLPELFDDCMKYINVSVKSEDNYQWTDKEEFQKILKDYKTEHPLRVLLNEYFNTVKYNIKNNVPKLIKYTYIRELHNRIFELLMISLTKQHVQSSLLVENPEQFQKRKIYELQKEKLLMAKKLLQIR
jgi:hypothetical protein